MDENKKYRKALFDQPPKLNQPRTVMIKRTAGRGSRSVLTGKNPFPEAFSIQRFPFSYPPSSAATYRWGKATFSLDAFHFSFQVFAKAKPVFSYKPFSNPDSHVSPRFAFDVHFDGDLAEATFRPLNPGLKLTESLLLSPRTFTLFDLPFPAALLTMKFIPSSGDHSATTAPKPPQTRLEPALSFPPAYAPICDKGESFIVGTAAHLPPEDFRVNLLAPERLLLNRIKLFKKAPTVFRRHVPLAFSSKTFLQLTQRHTPGAYLPGPASFPMVIPRLFPTKPSRLTYRFATFLNLSSPVLPLCIGLKGNLPTTYWFAPLSHDHIQSLTHPGLLPGTPPGPLPRLETALPCRVSSYTPGVRPLVKPPQVCCSHLGPVWSFYKIWPPGLFKSLRTVRLSAGFLKKPVWISAPSPELVFFLPGAPLKAYTAIVAKATTSPGSMHRGIMRPIFAPLPALPWVTHPEKLLTPRRFNPGTQPQKSLPASWSHEVPRRKNVAKMRSLARLPGKYQVQAVHSLRPVDHFLTVVPQSSVQLPRSIDFLSRVRSFALLLNHFLAQPLDRISRKCPRIRSQDFRRHPPFSLQKRVNQLRTYIVTFPLPALSFTRDPLKPLRKIRAAKPTLFLNPLPMVSLTISRRHPMNGTRFPSPPTFLRIRAEELRVRSSEATLPALDAFANPRRVPPIKFFPAVRTLAPLRHLEPENQPKTLPGPAREFSHDFHHAFEELHMRPGEFSATVQLPEFEQLFSRLSIVTLKELHSLSRRTRRRSPYSLRQPRKWFYPYVATVDLMALQYDPLTEPASANPEKLAPPQRLTLPFFVHFTEDELTQIFSRSFAAPRFSYVYRFGPSPRAGNAADLIKTFVPPGPHTLFYPGPFAANPLIAPVTAADRPALSFAAETPHLQPPRRQEIPEFGFQSHTLSTLTPRTKVPMSSTGFPPPTTVEVVSIPPFFPIIHQLTRQELITPSPTMRVTTSAQAPQRAWFKYFAFPWQPECSRIRQETGFLLELADLGLNAEHRFQDELRIAEYCVPFELGRRLIEVPQLVMSERKFTSYYLFEAPHPTREVFFLNPAPAPAPARLPGGALSLLELTLSARIDPAHLPCLPFAPRETTGSPTAFAWGLQLIPGSETVTTRSVKGLGGPLFLDPPHFVLQLGSRFQLRVRFFPRLIGFSPRRAPPPVFQLPGCIPGSIPLNPSGRPVLLEKTERPDLVAVSVDEFRVHALKSSSRRITPGFSPGSSPGSLAARPLAASSRPFTPTADAVFQSGPLALTPTLSGQTPVCIDSRINTDLFGSPAFIPDPDLHKTLPPPTIRQGRLTAPCRFRDLHLQDWVEIQGKGRNQLQPRFPPFPENE
jgi:hypothetical protein